MRTTIIILSSLAILGMGAVIPACGDDGGGGVCLHDFGPSIECFEGWSQADCDENSWDWMEGETCSGLGYTSLCGGQSYTLPGQCPL